MFVAAVYAFTIIFIGQCNEYRSDSLLTEAYPENEVQDVQKFSSTQVSWWKAGLSEYNIIEDTETGSIEPAYGDAVAEMETTTATSTSTEQTTASVIQKTNSPAPNYASEIFTVYDQNSRRYVTLDGYEMLCQIVRNEVGAHYTYGSKNGQTAYDKEVIKAFTVAAYSMLKYCERKGETATVGLNSNMSDSLRSHVAEVDGQAAYYNGAYICAIYCAATGGTTLSSKNSWGIANPYLVGVESKYDSLGSQYVTTQVFTTAEMKAIIEKTTNIKLSSNPANWISIASTIEGGYVDQMIIDGNSTVNIRGKEYRLTGSYFRYNIMEVEKLKSPDFTVKYSDGNFYFTVYGYGHGVGMPAEGAQQYALQEGWNYQQILKHYYTGIQIV